MVLTQDSNSHASRQAPHFTLHYDPWVRSLLALLPGVRERSGIDVGDKEVRVRIRPGVEVRMPRDSVSRVWRIRAGEHGTLFGLPHMLGAPGKSRGVWWLNGSLDNLVAIDIDPPATGHMWGIPVKPKCVIVSLENPEGFIEEMLG